MKLRLFLPAVVVITVAACSNPDKIEESAYYPVGVGSTWTYRAPSSDPKAGKATYITHVAAHEKISGVMCAKIEALSGTSAAGTDHISVTKSGIYRCTLNGDEAGTPIQLLKLPPGKGDEWSIDSKGKNGSFSGKATVKEESLNVPAGSYQALVVNSKVESLGQTITCSNYFVKDVGIAKIQLSAVGSSVNLELEKFLAVGIPPTGFTPGKTVTYKPVVYSSGGGSSLLTLDAGPPGMSIKDGEMSWDVPAKFSDSSVNVTIGIKNGGQSIVHTFTLTKGN
jgi:hypothetical protein